MTGPNFQLSDIREIDRPEDDVFHMYMFPIVSSLNFEENEAYLNP